MTQPRWLILCRFLNKYDSSIVERYGVTTAKAMTDGIEGYNFVEASTILDDIRMSKATYVVAVLADPKTSVQVVEGSKVHRVVDAKSGKEWLSTNPNDTLVDNLSELPTADELAAAHVAHGLEVDAPRR